MNVELTFEKIYQLSQISGMDTYRIYYNLRQTAAKKSGQEIRDDWITLCEETFKIYEKYEDLERLYVSVKYISFLNYSSNRSDFRAYDLGTRIFSKMAPLCVETIRQFSTNEKLDVFYHNLPQNLKYADIVAEEKRIKTRQLYHVTIMTAVDFATAISAINALKERQSKVKDDEWAVAMQLADTYDKMVSFLRAESLFNETYISGYKKIVSMTEDIRKLSWVIRKYAENEHTYAAKEKLNRLCEEKLKKTRSIAKLQEIEECATDQRIIKAALQKRIRLIDQRSKKAKTYKTIRRFFKQVTLRSKIRNDVLERAYELASNNSELSELLKEVRDDDAKIRDRILKKMYGLLP